jgi:hypothetical protein
VTIAWTDDARARVYPSRAMLNPAFLPAQVARLGSANPWRFPFDAEACYAQARRHWARPSRRIDALVRTGLAQNPQRWRDAVERAVAAERPEELVPLDIDVEAVTVALELCPAFAAMPLWLAAEGPGFAAAALAAVHRLDSFAKREGYLDARGTWIVETGAREWHTPEYADSAWFLLRGALATADDATHAAARARAEALRERAPAVVQAMLGFAFADDAWATATCAEAIAIASRQKKLWSWMFARLATVASRADAEALVRGNRAVDEADLLTLLARHGADALPIVVAAIEGSSHNDHRKACARVLLRVHTEAAAAAFGRLAKHKALAPIAKQHAAAMRGR